jgi:hypothetical protein
VKVKSGKVRAFAAVSSPVPQTSLVALCELQSHRDFFPLLTYEPRGKPPATFFISTPPTHTLLARYTNMSAPTHDTAQSNGESDAAFHLRTVESKLRESEAMRLQENESSQSKLVQVEHDLKEELKEEKSKRVQAEHKLVWAQFDIDGLLSEVVQLTQDLRKEKNKSAADENNKPADEPAKKNELQLIMDDLDGFASTATDVANALEALYAPAAEVEEH